MTRRDSLGQMSHSDLVELVLEQERIFEEAAQEWKADVVRYREALERAREYLKNPDADTIRFAKLTIAALGDER